jgi:hypothetical protein
MDLLKERFLRVYANIPLNLREDVILVLKDSDSIEKPLSWNAVYVEVKAGTDRSQKILEELTGLGLI